MNAHGVTCVVERASGDNTEQNATPGSDWHSYDDESERAVAVEPISDLGCLAANGSQ